MTKFTLIKLFKPFIIEEFRTIDGPSFRIHHNDQYIQISERDMREKLKDQSATAAFVKEAKALLGE